MGANPGLCSTAHFRSLTRRCWTPGACLGAAFLLAGLAAAPASALEITAIKPPMVSADGSTDVTISGSGFDRTTEATIGRKPLAKMEVQNDHTIIGKAPALDPGEPLGAQDVTVLDPRTDASSTLRGGVTYVESEPQFRCFPYEPTPGWVGFNLGGLPTTYRPRDDLPQGFEICGQNQGYMPADDNIMLLLRGIVSQFSFDRSLRVDEVSPSGLAGLDLRAGPSLPLEYSPMVRIAAHRDPETGAVRLKSSYRLGPGQESTTASIGVELPIHLMIQCHRYEQDKVRFRTLYSADGETWWEQLMVHATGTDLDVDSFHYGMAQASESEDPAYASFCMNGAGNDFDGDGCTDCVDEDPFSSVVSSGHMTGPCCPPRAPSFSFAGDDPDGDRIPSCRDPDDDGDGIPDKEDPCPQHAGAACLAFFDCPCPTDWLLCDLDCVIYFLKFHSLVNPQRQVVFEKFNIINLDFYIQPAAGQTPAEGAMSILGLVGGEGGGGGAFKDAIVMEIWERTATGLHLRATVGQFDPGEVQLGDLDAPKLMHANISPGTDHGPALELGSSWVLGVAPGVHLPDTDADGIPNAFDNCPNKFNPDQHDSDQDGIGDVCQLIEAIGGVQIPGDGNQDGKLDISDAAWLLGFLFLGTVPQLPCGDGTAQHPANRILLDGNGDGKVDLSDVVAVLSHLFLGGPPHVLGKDCRFLPVCPDVPACAR